ncbi:GGDEF domain-containing protein [bacterium]|nr:MAG: GGDEF domain-containing protein [bacterium]
MHIYTVDKRLLDEVLERKRDDSVKPGNIDLGLVLKEILLQANKFVPSESGSILLDTSALNKNRRATDVLYFVACFGKGSSKVVGKTIPINIGIAGNTYASGKPYISKKVKSDKHFYADMDKKTKYLTQSIICAPIKLCGAGIGVIELINKRKSVNYESGDLTLLKIFAEYTSTLIQNSLDAKNFGELSIRDNLTGLYNDRYVFDRLGKESAKALRSDRDLSLMFFDLDRFKEINDTHGHLAGSRVLKEVGEIMFDTVGKTSAVPARYGGDEFVIILPGMDIQKAAELAEKLRKKIERFIFINKRHHGIGRALSIKNIITGSFGVASLKANIGTKASQNVVCDKLIRLSDKAMYDAKGSGKNKVTLSDAKPGRG